MVQYLWLGVSSLQSDNSMSAENWGGESDSSHDPANPQLVPSCDEVANGSAIASPEKVPEPTTNDET